MVIDTSALLAILADEPERKAYAEAIDRDSTRLLSAVTVAETSIVLERRYGPDAVDDLELLLSRIDADVAAFGAQDIPLLREAYRAFGKGAHPAGLNFGDCFAYALAVLHGEPLLFKGEDFPQTDVRRVVLPSHPERSAEGA